MKKLLFLFCLFLICSVGLSQNYDLGDAQKLKSFLNETAYVDPPKPMSYTNAQLIKGENYVPDWNDIAAWIREFDAIFQWEELPEGSRIKRITFSGYDYQISGACSGNFDFSGCDYLEEVFASNEQLTAANFENCTSLKNVILNNNRIESINLKNCELLETVDLEENRLLPSKIDIDLDISRPINFSFSFREQSVQTSNYVLVWKDDDLYLEIDLRPELRFDMEFWWHSLNQDFITIDEDNGVFYCKLEDVISERYVNLYCYMSNSDTLPIQGSLNYNIMIPMGNIYIYVNPPSVENAKAYIYLMQNDAPFYMATVPANENTIYIGYLPAGEYIIGVEATGYMFTYYHAALTHDVPVVSWKEASKVSLSADPASLEIFVDLNPKPSTTGNITISGSLLPNNSLLKAGVLAQQKATVVLQSSSNLKSDELFLIDTTEPEDGKYSFQRLIEGNTYYISVDIAGYEMGNPIIVHTSSSSGNDLYDNNNFLIDETNKTINAEVISSDVLLDMGLQLTVYPNPVTDNEVRIKGLDGSYIVKTIDMSGRVVSSVTGSSPELTLQFGNLPSGMYLLRIESKGKTYIRKIIKL